MLCGHKNSVRQLKILEMYIANQWILWFMKYILNSGIKIYTLEFHRWGFGF